jgi:hypothetical protein
MIENEVILLKAVYDHIGDMVNYSTVEIQDWDDDKIVVFKDSNARKLFYILLSDFLSKTDGNGPIKQVSFLQGLAEICEAPYFPGDGSHEDLQRAVQDFRDWLNTEKEIDIWMPSISSQLKLKLSWADAARMSGDVSKHNYLRAIGVAKRLQSILGAAGKAVSLDEALQSLPDFYERFHGDILIYLSSHICEFLNNIRWGIYTYLLPEYQRSFYRTDEVTGGYRFRVPVEITSKYASGCYWDLMNYVRSRPYMEKFRVPHAFKSYY